MRLILFAPLKTSVRNTRVCVKRTLILYSYIIRGHDISFYQNEKIHRLSMLFLNINFFEGNNFYKSCMISIKLNWNTQKYPFNNLLSTSSFGYFSLSFYSLWSNKEKYNYPWWWRWYLNISTVFNCVLNFMDVFVSLSIEIFIQRLQNFSNCILLSQI